MKNKIKKDGDNNNIKQNLLSSNFKNEKYSILLQILFFKNLSETKTNIPKKETKVKVFLST